MLYYAKDKVIKYNGINGEAFSFLTDLKKITGRVLGRIAGSDLSSYSTMDEIANSSTAMNAVASSETARNIVYNSTTAWNIVSTNNMAIGKLVAGFVGLNPADYADIDAVANSSTAMNAVVNSETAMDIVANSSTAMNAVVNSETAMDIVANSEAAMNAVVNSETAMDIVANSEAAMDKVVVSSVAIDKIIRSAIALYYICVNNPQGKGLEKLAGNIEGTTTVNWESFTKWQIIYDTLDNASNLFNKSYYKDIKDTSRVKDRQGDLITLVIKCYAWNNTDYYLGISPRYSGCYSHPSTCNWSTGKHIMWGGHTSYHGWEDRQRCYVEHYMFTPIT